MLGHQFRVLLFVSILGFAISSDASDPRLEFTRMVAHWSQYGDPDYLEFIEKANPELVQLGFYGGHFWSLAHTPQFGGYPAHFPVQGIPEGNKWFKEKNSILRKKKIKVIGHFNVEFLVGEPDSAEGPRGFFKFYRELWDEKLLGPKPPVEDPVEFLEKDREGNPVPKQSYSIGGMHEYFACLRNPHWQYVLKAWVTHGIKQGLDGFIANYFYRHDCLCEHCQSGFRKYLAERHDKAGLKEFGISRLEDHVFEEIECWHKPEESTPLRREMLRWSQISNKEVFDEVFLKHGRSLKSDLIVAQWNHLSDFSQIKGDERSLLPAERWGADENYLWYSTGASAVYTDLKNGVLGDATLQARYIRGSFDDKPYTLGKYEAVRTRAAIAELAANGGAPMGFYAKFKDPDASAVFARYYGFLEEHHRIFHANQSLAEVALLFPRKAIHRGDLGALEEFKKKGRELLDEHILFDVIPDDILDRVEMERYVGVVDPSKEHGDLDPGIRKALSSIEAGPFVRASVSRPAGGGEVNLHFVNYNREELPPHKNGRPNPGKGPGDEKPISTDPIPVRYFLSHDDRKVVESIEVITPENEPVEIPFETKNNRVVFEVPSFPVYAIARLKLTHRNPDKLPKVAGVTTVYHHNSHSDVLFSRMTETDSLDWTGRKPNLDLTSVYVDQFPENDIGRAHSEKYQFPLVKSVPQALTNEQGDLAVDGVLLVGEHGDYPRSDTTQIIYPKRRLFSEIVDTFRKTGKVVPVFCDKHLADNWEDAKWIYDQSKEMDFPLMAGSSIPGLWRYPATDVQRDAKLEEIVGISYHTLDAYGFHGMEMIQCLAERRAGGETGIKRVRCITGPEVWTSDLYNRELFEKALERQWNQKYLRRKPLQELVKDPVLFVMDYEDGLRASMLTLNGAAISWTAAWKYTDETGLGVDSSLFWTQEERPFYHFAILLRNIESMVESEKPPWPVERTLMSSGALDALLISKRDGGHWLDTPHLGFEYQSDWNWKQPPPPPRGRPHDQQ